ncbi:MAG: hypothetical protein HOP02_08815 [Methylococcaceae bacterium]|nr:hypothetical protein [Methylococcaceae bacterium]
MKRKRWALQIGLWILLGLGQPLAWAAGAYQVGLTVPNQPAPPVFNQPEGIAAAADGSVWVADTGNSRIQHFNAYGTLISMLRIHDGNAVGFIEPTSIAIAADGSLWVASSNRIQHVKTDGTLISVMAKSSPFDYIKNIAIAADGSLWVRIRRSNGKHLAHYKADGTLIAEISVGYSKTGSREGIAMAADGSIWITTANAENHGNGAIAK